MKPTLITLATFGLAEAVSAQEVSYIFDASGDFTKYRSYRWAEIPGGVKLDESTAKQLTSALDAELARKGLTKTESENADLYVDFQAAMGQEKEVTAYDAGWGLPRWGSKMTTAVTSTLDAGSVALDIYEISRKHRVWRGVITKTLGPGGKPDKRIRNIQKAVAKLLQNYPPKKP